MPSRMPSRLGLQTMLMFKQSYMYHSKRHMVVHSKNTRAHDTFSTQTGQYPKRWDMESVVQPIPLVKMSWLNVLKAYNVIQIHTLTHWASHPSYILYIAGQEDHSHTYVGSAHTHTHTTLSIASLEKTLGNPTTIS